MSRILSVFLSIVLFLILFSGCHAEINTLQNNSSTTIATEDYISNSLLGSYIITSWEDEDGGIYIGNIDPETGEIISENYYGHIDYPEDMYESPEDMQAKYPGKKVLVWASGDFLAGSSAIIPIDEINSYLDSLGKDYVICYSPMSMFYIQFPGNNTIQITQKRC